MVKAINTYKCHFNLNIANDINYRSFETIGCGTMLLTNYNPIYEELGFINQNNCLFYNNINDLTEKINNLNQIDISKISNNGLNLALKHTYKQRVKNLLEIL